MRLLQRVQEIKRDHNEWAIYRSTPKAGGILASWHERRYLSVQQSLVSTPSYMTSSNRP